MTEFSVVQPAVKQVLLVKKSRAGQDEEAVENRSLVGAVEVKKV